MITILGIILIALPFIIFIKLMAPSDEDFFKAIAFICLTLICFLVGILLLGL